MSSLCYNSTQKSTYQRQIPSSWATNWSFLEVVGLTKPFCRDKSMSEVMFVLATLVCGYHLPPEPDISEFYICLFISFICVFLYFVFLYLCILYFCILFSMSEVMFVLPRLAGGHSTSQQASQTLNKESFRCNRCCVYCHVKIFM